MLNKNPTWEELIRIAMEDWARSPMKWGIDDCALAIANMDRKMLGTDTASELRGRYRSERGAKRVLGAGGLPAAIRRAAKRLRWVRVKPSTALPGSRGLADNGLGPTLFIKYSGKFWVGRSDQGFAVIDDSMIKVAWTVG